MSRPKKRFIAGGIVSFLGERGELPLPQKMPAINTDLPLPCLNTTTKTAAAAAAWSD